MSVSDRLQSTFSPENLFQVGYLQARYRPNPSFTGLLAPSAPFVLQLRALCETASVARGGKQPLRDFSIWLDQYQVRPRTISPSIQLYKVYICGYSMSSSM